MSPVRIALAVFLACAAGAAVAADNPANKARKTLKECLDTLPLAKLSDEKAIAECLGEAQDAAKAEEKRNGQIEFNRQLDDMDRLIERTTRGSRAVRPPG